MISVKWRDSLSMIYWSRGLKKVQYFQLGCCTQSLLMMSPKCYYLVYLVICRFIEDVNGSTCIHNHIKGNTTDFDWDHRNFWYWWFETQGIHILIVIAAIGISCCWYVICHVCLGCNGIFHWFLFVWNWRLRMTNLSKMIRFSTVVTLLAIVWTQTNNVGSHPTTILTCVVRLVNLRMLFLKHWFSWLLLTSHLLMAWFSPFHILVPHWFLNSCLCYQGIKSNICFSKRIPSEMLGWMIYSQFDFSRCIMKLTACS